MKNTNEYMRQYMADYRKKLKKSGIKKSNVTEFASYHRRLRKRVIEFFGSKCVECQCDIPEILEINHIKGKGRKDKLYSENIKSFYRKLLTGKLKKEKYNLLCRVCNANHYVRDILGIKGITVSFSRMDQLVGHRTVNPTSGRSV